MNLEKWLFPRRVREKLSARLEGVGFERRRLPDEGRGGYYWEAAKDYVREGNIGVL